MADKRLDTDRKVEKVDKAISRAQYYEHITNSRELLDKAYIDGIKAKLEILQSMN